jgi:hypothetical protein
MVLNPNGAASIASLFAFCDKAAIAWFVIAVYVIAFNGHFWRVAICQCPVLKWFKLLPLLTEVYTSAAIAFVSSSFGILTSGFHGLPNAIKTLSGHSMRQGRFRELRVSSLLGFSVARFKASAVSRDSSSKIIGDDPFLFPADALAKPVSAWSGTGFGGSIFVGTYYGPVIELLVS